MLPSAAARALDEDPEQLDLVCLDLLAYASIKDAFDRAGNDDKSIEHLKDHPHMLAVRRNAFDLHMERVKARQEREKQASQPQPQASRRETQKREPDAGPRAPRPRTRERTQHGR